MKNWLFLFKMLLTKQKVRKIKTTFRQTTKLKEQHQSIKLTSSISISSVSALSNSVSLAITLSVWLLNSVVCMLLTWLMVSLMSSWSLTPPLNKKNVK